MGKSRKIPEVKARGKGKAGPGKADLSAYPLLVLAPLAHGEGVRTEDNGTPVREIAASRSRDVKYLAGKFGTTPAHVEQALKYVADHPEG